MNRTRRRYTRGKQPWILLGSLALAMLLATIGMQATERDSQAPPVQATSADEAIVPVFDCYQTNSAWGFTLSGKVVDAKGSIWSYGRRGKAWLPTRTAHEPTLLKAADLHEKYDDAKRVGNIDATLLQQKSALLAAAAAGKISVADTGARDAGSSSCHAYIRDEARDAYRDVELGSDGGVSDMRVTNSAVEAPQLLDWLRSIGVAR
jgi:hypothetical protein